MNTSRIRFPSLSWATPILCFFHAQAAYNEDAGRVCKPPFSMTEFTRLCSRMPTRESHTSCKEEDHTSRIPTRALRDRCDELAEHKRRPLPLEDARRPSSRGPRLGRSRSSLEDYGCGRAE